METENEKKTAEEMAEKKASSNALIAKCKVYGKKCSVACRDNRKTIALIIAVAVIIGGSLGYKQYQKKHDIGPIAAKAVVQKFVDENVPAGTKTEISNPVKEVGLYKVSLSVSGQKMDTYLSLDGKKFFPQAIDLSGGKDKDSAAAAKQAAKTEAENKTDVPEIDLFTMSFCPYGTQIEKGILPVVDLLGSKIKFNLKFVDYAMHGDKEITENLRQYCIQETQPTKLSSYLKCFLKKGEGTADACLKTAGVNSAQVGTCFSETDKKLSIKANAADKSKWSNATYPPFDVNKEDVTKYGVQGSPTLVVNGTTVSSGRDSASILKAVCSGFTNQPKECSQPLSSATPAPGFGEGTVEGASTEADCATPEL